MNILEDYISIYVYIKFFFNILILYANFLDDDEMAYWDKIARDREEQLNRKGKVQRGRDKLLKRAEKKLGKCIKFDQD